MNTDTKLISCLLPPKFSGRNDEDFEEWLKCFNRCSVAHQWTVDRKTEIIPALLAGQAADIYDDMRQLDKTIYPRVIQALRQKLCSPEKKHLYMNQLYNLKQSTSEPVSEYARSIEKLVKKSYPDMVVNERDAIMREHFVHGLQDNLKRWVLQGDSITFEEAERRAIREECNSHLTTIIQNYTNYTELLQ
ncbi:unnamed protein product [Didymodactylos carnosus]|uniref:Retrotransposon gag domain-containing protein n=1 Tax=Didymodactylos carnosus TaxID=1234261 RepID=A0A814EVJ6_9BILA|nr:unnamed protein product [Didymodactylos carnosus]CAF3749396.1 unnamed protein product [Didymodactylos carnosus]